MATAFKNTSGMWMRCSSYSFFPFCVNQRYKLEYFWVKKLPCKTKERKVNEKCSHFTMCERLALE